ncbi:MAG: hypothetical protein VX519_12030 [Myxococcota bacterium]|nr:hypothetical protein [Myxococcota bacterium]
MYVCDVGDTDHMHNGTDWGGTGKSSRLEEVQEALVSQDPRMILDDAARSRLACEIMSREGGWLQGQFVRVDKAGVVVVAPGCGFAGGEDVRICFQHEEKPCTFEASVLRAGVPVPDRSQHGLMLGFIDGFKLGDATNQEEAASQGASITILPPMGRGLQLLGGEARVVELTVVELTFTVPVDEPLKFVEGGRVRLRFEQAELGQHMAAGTVRQLSRGEGWMLYGVGFDEVEDMDSHLRMIEAMQLSS